MRRHQKMIEITMDDIINVFGAPTKGPDNPGAYSCYWNLLLDDGIHHPVSISIQDCPSLSNIIDYPTRNTNRSCSNWYVCGYEHPDHRIPDRGYLHATYYMDYVIQVLESNVQFEIGVFGSMFAEYLVDKVVSDDSDDTDE